MVRFRFDDQDFFEVDPVRYADALGELGLAAYRSEVKQRVEAGGGDSFAPPTPGSAWPSSTATLRPSSGCWAAT